MSQNQKLPKIEFNEVFSNYIPIEVFRYPNQASKIIWQVNSNNILQISSQIIDLIKTNKIPIEMALFLIDAFSKIRVKDIQLFAELYQTIANAFSHIIEPYNSYIATILYHKGIKFEYFEPRKTQEEILNLYTTDLPLYYIAWDKIDELKSKFPNLKVNEKIRYGGYLDSITPLDCAIKFGSELCFNYLKNMEAKYTQDSAMYACKGGNIKIFEQMIEDNQSFDNMIDNALTYKNYKIAEYLHNNFGQSPSSFAESMYFGNYDVASYLLSNGAYIDDTYDRFDKYTPIEIAIKQNSIEIVQYFIEHGANINIEEKCYLGTAIEVNSIKMVKYLVEQGAEVNKLYCDGKKYPLIVASKENSLEIVQYLVEHGADVNMKANSGNDSYKDCPLSVAIKKNSLEIVRYLVEHGANVNRKTSWRNDRNACPLTVAINTESIEIVRYLVEHGADVNKKIGDESCPLMVAIKKKSIEMVQYLVEHGADVNMKTLLCHYIFTGVIMILIHVLSELQSKMNQSKLFNT